MSILERLEKQKNPQTDDVISLMQETGTPNNIFYLDEYGDLKEKIHSEMIEIINRDINSEIDFSKDQEEYLLKTISSLIDSKPVKIARGDKERLVREIYHNVAGLGPLEPLLADPEITEIMVNGPYYVYVERRGKIDLTTTKFKDETHLRNVINRIVSTVGRHIDEASPLVDARLADGSRFNAIIPPLAIKGPTVTIRKFSKNPYTVN
ncbi:MAG: ATPase, T2SS/T4P/T4SS family, partial [Bacillota bacterium]